MRASGPGRWAILCLGSLLVAGLPVAASATSRTHRVIGHRFGYSTFIGFSSFSSFGGHGGLSRRAFYAKHGSKGRRYALAWQGEQCVPFARDASGIELSGNAWTWWDEAAGVYERGSAPEPGSILAFRANGSMRLGHVAVVSRVINAREIEIDHANWGGYRGSIARGMPVVDVSPNNDWTAVRVGLGDGDEFGSIYPTHGFIYGRADRGAMVTATAAPSPTPALNPAPRDLRPVADQADGDGYEEVAEAPAPRHRYRRHHHHVLR